MLVFLFMLAIISLILLTQLLLMVALRYGSATTLTLQGSSFWSSFSWNTLAEIATGILVIISLASLFKISQLRAGGSAVAELLGGQLLDRSSNQLDERKVLNVVEEMAIASGLPVPPVYIIEDVSINAFAAGHDTHDVAIGITRGCIQILDRDELQGVIAHEFSHILNGDMKINLRLIGILHGILFIGLIGRFCLDTTTHHSFRSRNNRGTGPLIFLGIGLLVIGYCGTFFGNLIKAAISRQREFLADASAVQFTRNPSGISNALKKIGGYPAGSRIMHPRANEMSHLFFGDGLKHWSWSWFATHPPLDERILAIEPRWKGEFPEVATPDIAKQTAIDPASVQIVDGEVFYQRTAMNITPEPSNTLPAYSLSQQPTTASIAMATAMESIGSPSIEHITHARETLNAIPDNLLRLSRETYGARAVIFCLLLDKQIVLRNKQLQLLQKTTDSSVFTLCEKIADTVDNVPITLRLALIDLCLPSLKPMSTAQQSAFMKTVMMQIRADDNVSLFEWALYSLLRHHLNTARKPSTSTARMETLEGSCRIILSALALATQLTSNEAEAAFDQGWKNLGLPTTTLDVNALGNLSSLDSAVLELTTLQALGKPRFLKACCTAIEQNNCYSPEGIELIRAIADTIDAPIPPIINKTASSR